MRRYPLINHRTYRYLGLLGMLIVLNGCATTTVRYTLKETPVQTAPLPYHVVVGVFTDERPQEERVEQKPPKNTSPRSEAFYTSDKNFKSNIPYQIATAMADHLRQTNLVQKVTVNVDTDIDAKPEVLDQLAREGVDLVITGHLVHFTGYVSGFTPGGTVAERMGGALGVLSETIAHPKTVGGLVEYQNLKIIDMTQGLAVWKGDVSHRFERQETWWKTPTHYALEALGEANAKMVEQLEQTLQAIKKRD